MVVLAKYSLATVSFVAVELPGHRNRHLHHMNPNFHIHRYLLYTFLRHCCRHFWFRHLMPVHVELLFSMPDRPLPQFPVAIAALLAVVSSRR